MASRQRGASTQVYAIANLNHDFVAGSHVTVDGTTLTQENDPVWGEIGLGFSYNMTDKWKVYAERSYNTSLSHVGDSYVAKDVKGVSSAF